MAKAIMVTKCMYQVTFDADEVVTLNKLSTDYDMTLIHVLEWIIERGFLSLTGKVPEKAG